MRNVDIQVIVVDHGAPLWQVAEWLRTEVLAYEVRLIGGDTVVHLRREEGTLGTEAMAEYIVVAQVDSGESNESLSEGEIESILDWLQDLWANSDRVDLDTEQEVLGTCYTLRTKRCEVESEY